MPEKIFGSGLPQPMTSKDVEIFMEKFTKEMHVAANKNKAFVDIFFKIAKENERYCLSFRQLVIFLDIYLLNGNGSVKDIAKRTGYLKPSVTRNLNVLEEFKLIRKERPKTNGRIVEIYKTRDGVALLHDFFGPHPFIIENEENGKCA